jgi:membrane-bound serine protease (ClpP class)
MTALGIALLTVGATMIIVEAHLPALGALGGPGVVAVGVGAVLTVSGLGGGVVLGVISALLLALTALSVLGLSLKRGAAVQGRRIRTGAEGLIGHVGEVRSWGESAGRVFVDGALWRARQSWPDAPAEDLHEGDHVVVERISGLTLAVRKAEEWELVQ